ncbi:MAG: KDO2-lipid IV(A) lauroyltransferase [Verrucomicrobiales bacterium]
MKPQETPPSAPLLLRARFFVEASALSLAVAATRHMPRPALSILARVLGTLTFLIDFRGRATAEENLRCAFPEKTPRERRALARQSYEHMAFTFLDLFWARNLTAENWPDYIDHVVEDPAATDLAEKSSAVWITPHYGNFEWSALVQGLRGIQIQIIAQNFRNAALTPLFKQLRQKTGHRIIPQERAMIRLFKALKSGGHTALLSDLNVELSQSPAIIDCFGMKTCVTTLHAILAVRCDVPVLPVVVTRLPGGRYRMTMTPPMHFKKSDSTAHIAQCCWDAFEPHIRKNPAQWLWMYKHWRYRPASAASADYPSYANEKRKFDKILAAQDARD